MVCFTHASLMKKKIKLLIFLILFFYYSERVSKNFFLPINLRNSCNMKILNKKIFLGKFVKDYMLLVDEKRKY
tara:strand:+ start:337 stop:555 length:219 start_codon:yes stop_codon:yes gene_type:complete